MAIKLFDSELKVMDVLWKEGDKTAKQISDILKEEIGWNMNTTYTVIKKCIAKGAIERSEPNFMCHALIAKEVVQEAEAEELIDEELFPEAASCLTAPPTNCLPPCWTIKSYPRSKLKICAGWWLNWNRR